MSGQQPERIMLPRLGRHTSIWGSGHTCNLPGEQHDGPCVCECGTTQPWNKPLPEPAGGPFQRTTPGTRVTFYPDGVQFTDPDGTMTWKPYPPADPDEDEDDYRDDI